MLFSKGSEGLEAAAQLWTPQWWAPACSLTLLRWKGFVHVMSGRVGGARG